MNIRGDTPMTTSIAIKLTPDERKELESYAARHSMTISEAVRDILERHVKEQSK